MLSHELRQPLTNIAGLVNMLMQHQVASDVDRKELLGMIHSSVNKLDDAIKALVKKAAREL
jgi:signal transduction histidine kinase